MSGHVYYLDMRSLGQAGQHFFKAVEAINSGHGTIGFQALEALSFCKFPQISARARDALDRFRNRQMEGAH